MLNYPWFAAMGDRTEGDGARGVKPEREQFDVVVLGAGTAGLAAAKAASTDGARVAVVDHGPLGTLCARLGCMPSKALLQSTSGLFRARRLGRLGIDLTTPPSFDWPAVRARTSELVAEFVASVVEATTTSKAFLLIRGTAEFVDENTLHVGDRLLTARRWIVATGSSPVRPPLEGLDAIADFTLTSDDVFDLESIPSSVAVIGSGGVGIELGQFFARAGARVHVLTHDDRIAGLGPGPLQDAIRVPLERELTIHLSARIERVKRHGEGVALVVEKEAEVHVAKVLLAAGRRPNVDALGLSRIGVCVEGSSPVHDAFLRTTNHSVFVAGDAAGGPAVLHAATIQGHAAGRNATRDQGFLSPMLEPGLRVVFSDPIVATVGLDADSAKRAGHRTCVVARPWSEQGKARIMDETEGLAQLVVDRETRKVLGCQLVGPHADLLIHLASYAIHFGATVEDLLALNHYHPTLAEIFPSLARCAAQELDGVECPDPLHTHETGRSDAVAHPRAERREP
jgi:dihydrolipoamide dehydrogenase